MILEILWLKGTGTYKKQTRIPLELIIKKCPQNRNKFEQFLQISIQTDPKSTKRRTFKQKTPKSIHSWSNWFWTQIADVSNKVQYGKKSTQNMTHRWKKSFQLMMQLYSPTQWGKRQVYPISFLYVWTTFELQFQDFYASEEIQVFSNFRRPKRYFRHQKGHQRARAIIGSFLIIH